MEVDDAAFEAPAEEVKVDDADFIMIDDDLDPAVPEEDWGAGILIDASEAASAAVPLPALDQTKGLTDGFNTQKD